MAGEFKPVELASVPTMKQEEAQVSPQGDALAISPNGAFTQFQRSEWIENQRDPLAVPSANSSKSPKPVDSKRRKTRSAHSAPQTFAQLGLWDTAAETG